MGQPFSEHHLRESGIQNHSYDLHRLQDKEKWGSAVTPILTSAQGALLSEWRKRGRKDEEGCGGW